MGRPARGARRPGLGARRTVVLQPPRPPGGARCRGPGPHPARVRSGAGRHVRRGTPAAHELLSPPRPYDPEEPAIPGGNAVPAPGEEAAGPTASPAAASPVAAISAHRGGAED